MQPEAVRAGGVAGGRDVVHGAGVGRARAHDQEERAQARGPIRGHGFGESVEANPELRVAGNGAHPGGREPGQQRRLLDGVMRLVGRVEWTPEGSPPEGARGAR